MNIPTQGRPLAVAKEELSRAQDHQDLQMRNAMDREADLENALEAAKGILPEEVFALYMQMAKMMSPQPSMMPLPNADEFERQARQQAVYQYAPMYRSVEGDKETLIDFQAYVLAARSIEFDHAKGEARIWFGSDEEPLIFHGPAAAYLRRYLASLGIFQALEARDVCADCHGQGAGCVRCGEIGWTVDEAKIAGSKNG